jgi:hypothetical protein
MVIVDRYLNAIDVDAKAIIITTEEFSSLQ